MKKRLFSILFLVCLSLAACSAGKPAGQPGESGTSVPDASTPGVSASVQATTMSQTTVSAPTQTTPATTPPETAPPASIPLPVTKDALREGFSRHRPEFTLKEIVESDAGYFLFFFENKTPPLVQGVCELGIDFVDKQTGIFAQTAFPENYSAARDYLHVPLTGYSLINGTGIYLYLDFYLDTIYSSGRRNFPFLYKLTYENGTLHLDDTTLHHPIFYPVAMDQFYTGYLSDESKPTRVLSACFASAGSFSLLFDLLDVIEPEFLMDFTTLPRVNFHYDAKKHQMLLTSPNILIDKALTGKIPVSADDPYIQAVQLEPWGSGIQATLTLKPGAELYIPKITHVDRAPTRSPGVLFDLAFVSRDALSRYTSMYPAHIMENITFICLEE